MNMCVQYSIVKICVLCAMSSCVAFAQDTAPPGTETYGLDADGSILQWVPLYTGWCGTVACGCFDSRRRL
jgi:hypothetical protein